MLYQSLAMMEYLNDVPRAAAAAGRSERPRPRRALSLITVANSHSIIVPRVRNHLASTFNLDEEGKPIGQDFRCRSRAYEGTSPRQGHSFIHAVPGHHGRLFPRPPRRLPLQLSEGTISSHPTVSTSSALPSQQAFTPTPPPPPCSTPMLYLCINTYPSIPYPTPHHPSPSLLLPLLLIFPLPLFFLSPPAISLSFSLPVCFYCLLMRRAAPPGPAPAEGLGRSVSPQSRPPPGGTCGPDHALHQRVEPRGRLRPGRRQRLAAPGDQVHEGVLHEVDQDVLLGAVVVVHPGTASLAAAARPRMLAPSYPRSANTRRALCSTLRAAARPVLPP